MGIRVLVELTGGRSILIGEDCGYSAADLRAAARIFRRGITRGLVRRVRVLGAGEGADPAGNGDGRPLPGRPLHSRWS
jgi:hypothetical protein